jgi:AAA ATPase domain
LGPQGGGSLVGGSKRRDMMPATHGEKEFLVKERRKVPVASHEMFVGRRRELQTALRALRGRDHAGVLLHGMGRLGKSSLAARIANRRRDLKLAVVFEHYGTLDVLEALRLALEENPEAPELVRNGVQRVREDPSRLEETLIDLLRAASMQAGGTGTPVLLVIDDLERILEADPAGGRHRLQAAFAPVLRAVLRAFDRTIDSRLILTSRFPFALDGLEERLLHLQLPPLSPAAQRKLEQRQKTAAAEAGLAGEALAGREELLARVPAIARGNPGLQDLIGRRLVLSKAVTLEHAERALREMEAWLTQGSLPSDADVRQFLENLAIDSLVGLANEAGRNLLRGLTLFELPVPEGVAQPLETDASGALQHLRDLGLVDVLEDLVDQRQPAVAVNALVAGRLEPLGDPERDSLARLLARPLFLAWGGAAGTEKRPLACDLQLTRLALAAEDGEIVAACAAYAVMAWQGLAKEATALGQTAVALLEARRQAVPLRLLSETAKAASMSGDGGRPTRCWPVALQRTPPNPRPIRWRRRSLPMSRQGGS